MLYELDAHMPCPNCDGDELKLVIEVDNQCTNISWEVVANMTLSNFQTNLCITGCTSICNECGYNYRLK